MRFPPKLYAFFLLGAAIAENSTLETISPESVERDEICGGCILPKQPIGGSFELDWSNEGLCNILPKGKVPSGTLLNYACKEEDGYVLEGNPISFCHFNKWYLPPTCVRYCPALNLEGVHAFCRLHGQIVSCEVLTAPGTKASLTCKDSYKILPSVYNDPSYGEITCLDGGVWSHTVFQCIPECGIAVTDGRNITTNGSLVVHDSFPWHVTIYQKRTIENFELICAGTLISPNLVISAASCFVNETINEMKNASEILVVAGKHHHSYNISDHYSQKLEVEKIDVRRQRNCETQINKQDIALLRLKTSFEMTTLVRPVCMDWYNKHEKVPIQSGTRNNEMIERSSKTGSLNETVQEDHLPFIPLKKYFNEVSESLKDSTTADKLCSGCLNGSRSCASANGGGVYYMFQGVWFLRGITSLTSISNETCNKNYYIPFMNVGDHLELIRDVYLSTGNGLSYDQDSDDSMNYHYDVLLGEYGSCPWRQPNKHYSQGVVGLHEEIEDFFTYIRPTMGEHKLRLRVIKRIEDVVSDLWPDFKVAIFGSFYSGLILPTSDIDLKVLKMGQTLSLREMEKALLDRNIAEKNSIEVVENTHVPIVRLVDGETKIPLDISFDNTDYNGLQTTKLIESYRHQFPMLDKLILILKQFVVQRDLNKVYTGGIASYSLTLMAINFLQLHSRLNAYGPNGNLGVLLIEFLEFYGRKFDYVESCIRINGGGAYIPKKDVQCHMTGQNEPSLLCIENPLVAGDSITCKSYRALHLKEAFDRAYSVLSRAVSPHNIPGNDGNKVSILGRIIRVSDEVIAYRKWIKETFPLPCNDTDSLPNSTRLDASTLLNASDTNLEYSRGNSSDEAESRENKRTDDRHNYDHQQPHQLSIKHDKLNALANQQHNSSGNHEDEVNHNTAGNHPSNNTQLSDSCNNSTSNN